VKEVEKVVYKDREVIKEVEVPAKSWWARTFG
jgi:hypothetical protein